MAKSNSIFPTLPGLKWGVSKVPIFSTLIQRSTSGKEARAGLYVYPIWQYTLSYELLRDNALNELQSLLGLYLLMGGARDSFLYTDPDDHIVTGQAIGTGDGTTSVFPFVRTYAGFTEPVTDVVQPVGTPTPAPALNVYVAGTKKTSGYSVAYLSGAAKITFTSPLPSAGQAITADFSFYRRVRFVEYTEGGSDGFAQFMKNLWELNTLGFVTEK